MFVTVRLLGALSLAAVVAILGAVFLGEYEFDELLPIASGPLLGLVMAEIVASVGKVRTIAVGLLVATFAAVAVLLAGSIDANGIEPIKVGAYLSAALAASAAIIRLLPPRRRPPPDVLD